MSDNVNGWTVFTIPEPYSRVPKPQAMSDFVFDREETLEAEAWVREVSAPNAEADLVDVDQDYIAEEEAVIRNDGATARGYVEAASDAVFERFRRQRRLGLFE
jgi:hypothetical protein